MKTTMQAGHCLVAEVTTAGADNNQQKAEAGAAKMAVMVAAGAEAAKSINLVTS